MKRIAMITIFLLVVAQSFAFHPAPAPTNTPPPIVTNSLQRIVAYGDVNFWMYDSDEQIAKGCLLLRVNGCNCFDAELMGGGGSNLNKLDWLFGRYAVLKKNCDKQGLAIKLTVVNWNSTDIVNQSDAWFTSLVNRIASYGTDNVLPEISEWCDARNRSSALDAKAQRWVNLLQSTFPRNIWNKGSRPGSRPSGWSYLDWHMHNIQDIGSGDWRRLLCTDNGTPLAELGHGDRASQTFDPALVEDLVYRAIKSGQSIDIYHFWRTNGVDQAAVEAIGRGIKKAGGL